MTITQKLLTPGSTHGRTGTKLVPKGVVIHWVGNPKSTAIANRNYFENGAEGRHVSAHYIIGLDGEIIQCVPDNEVAQHATTANGTHIGIENCHPDATGKFNDKTYSALIELTADLCKRYGLNPLKDVIRHYDVSKKICPKYYVDNPTAWNKLLQDVNTAMTLTPIMGKSRLTVPQFIRYRAKWDNAPKLTNGSYQTLLDNYYEVGNIEGVRADIAICQAIHETNKFQYGGIVLATQNNFAGLGACDNNKPGDCNAFPSVEKGVRAHVQHLKGYASTEPLKLPCEDVRYKEIKIKGCAPYVEWLSIPNNPQKLGWASDKDYYPKIMNIYEGVAKA